MSEIEPAVGVLELVVEQLVPASPSQVFDAWTDATLLQSWWTPPGGRCTGAEVDLRVGGRYAIVNTFTDGVIVTIAGEFLDIRTNESLTYTWGIDPDHEPNEYVFVSFAPVSEGTLVTVRHEKIPTTELVDGHRSGWASCLTGLSTFPFAI